VDQVHAERAVRDPAQQRPQPAGVAGHPRGERPQRRRDGHAQQERRGPEERVVAARAGPGHVRDGDRGDGGRQQEDRRAPAPQQRLEPGVPPSRGRAGGEAAPPPHREPLRLEPEDGTQGAAGRPARVPQGAEPDLSRRRDRQQDQRGPRAAGDHGEQQGELRRHCQVVQVAADAAVPDQGRHVQHGRGPDGAEQQAGGQVHEQPGSQRDRQAQRSPAGEAGAVQRARPRGAGEHVAAQDDEQRDAEPEQPVQRRVDDAAGAGVAHPGIGMDAQHGQHGGAAAEVDLEETGSRDLAHAGRAW
jgi:hypothetical protein